MFGMGFTEIVLILIVAILFLGPDKLPEAMVNIAKFFRGVKKVVNEAKSTFEEEINIKELRDEALSYKHSLSEAGKSITGFKNSIPNPVEEISNTIEEARRDMISIDSSSDKLIDGFDEEIKEAKNQQPTAQSSRPTEFKNLKRGS